MRFTHLEWDSNFFKKKVGKLDVFTGECLTKINNKILHLKSIGYDLIYVFTPSEIELSQYEIYKLVDRKVVYEIDLSNIVLSNVENVIKHKGKVLNELYNLAFLSGQYSRFKLDGNFDTNDFYALYKVWIEKSLEKNEVYVFYKYDKLLGFITFSTKEDEGVIDLISVNPNAQGNGVGKALIQKVYSELLNRNINRLSVSTQKENKSACGFYEACGMSVRLITNIYHCWL